MDKKQKAQQRADQIQSFHDEVKLLASDQVLQLPAILLFLLPVLVLSNWGYGSYLPWDTTVIEGACQVLGFEYVPSVKGLADSEKIS